MNRPIEFRAWCEGKHRSLKFDTPHMEYDVIIVDGKYADVESYWDIHGTYATVPLMQFTGLLDKNGVKIFEGDTLLLIVEEIEEVLDFGQGPTNTIGKLFEVIFNKGCFGIKDDKKFISLSDIEDHFSCSLSEVEVIGNIFENPELLEEK